MTESTEIVKNYSGARMNKTKLVSVSGTLRNLLHQMLKSSPCFYQAGGFTRGLIYTRSCTGMVIRNQLRGRRIADTWRSCSNRGRKLLHGCVEINQHNRSQGRSQDVSLRGVSVRAKRAGYAGLFLGDRREYATPAAG